MVVVVASVVVVVVGKAVVVVFVSGCVGNIVGMGVCVCVAGSIAC